MLNGMEEARNNIGVITGCMIIVGIIVILYQTFNIITCLTFPEKIIIDELSSIYLNMK